MSWDKIWYIKCEKSLWKETEVCEEVRKRKVDVCCIQEVRWKGQGTRFVGTLGRRYKLWWSGNDAGFGGVGILVKEEIYLETLWKLEEKVTE